MTTEKMIALAKEKLGKEITEQEAQDYIDGKTALPDEALDIVSGGGNCLKETCYKCGSEDLTCINLTYTCNRCGHSWEMSIGG